MARKRGNESYLRRSEICFLAASNRDGEKDPCLYSCKVASIGVNEHYLSPSMAPEMLIGDTLRAPTNFLTIEWAFVALSV